MNETNLSNPFQNTSRLFFTKVLASFMIIVAFPFLSVNVFDTIVFPLGILLGVFAVLCFKKINTAVNSQKMFERAAILCLLSVLCVAPSAFFVKRNVLLFEQTKTVAQFII